MRARLLWTDGHYDLREIDPDADEIEIVGDDGRAHRFSASRSANGDGFAIWIEESREWERFHENGRRAVVYQHADVDPGRYSAGAPVRGLVMVFETNIGELDRAKAIADKATGCPQPCDCPPWTE